MTTPPLPSWNDGPTKQTILDFLDAADSVPVAERVAVLDNDGTLWCEKPSYTQLLFMLGEMQRAVGDDPSLGDRAEYRALLDNDKAAQSELGLPAIAMALVELCAGLTPGEFQQRVLDFVSTARHPVWDVPVRQLRYQPMLELIDALRAHDFAVCVVTGGGTEFVRAISNDFYGVDPERVVGSMIKYDVERDDAGRPRLVRTHEVFGEIDEGPAKVANLQFGLGRQPIFAAGNSPGDADMLDYVQGVDGPSLALLVNHDDDDREYAYEGVAGSFATEGSFLDQANQSGWTIASMRDDWSTIFAPE